MWVKKSEFSSNGIRGISYVSKNSKIEEKFDLGIFFSSFESRCLESSKLLVPNACQNAIIVYFEESKNHELRIRHDKLLLNQVSKCSRKKPHEIKDISISEIDKILKIILDKSLMSVNSKWFIDIVGAPMPYYLGLLGYLRQILNSPQVTLFNPTGIYGSGPEAHSFTSGFDKYMWIPTLWGKPNPVLPWTYMFLLGFEGHRSFEIYDRFEPRNVKALIGDPGYTAECKNIAYENNKEFINIAEPKILFANAADPIETWQVLQDNLEDDLYKTNICIVPIGTKPHALGGTLFALCSGLPSVLYMMPRAYKVKDIKRGDCVWKFDISL